MKIFITDPVAKYANTATQAASAMYADNVSNADFAYEAGHAAEAERAANADYANETDVALNLQCCQTPDPTTTTTTTTVTPVVAPVTTVPPTTYTVYSSQMRMWVTSTYYADYTNNKYMPVEYLWVPPSEFTDAETVYSYKDYIYVPGMGGMYTTINATGTTNRTVSSANRTSFFKYSYGFNPGPDILAQEHWGLFNPGQVMAFTFDVYAYGIPSLSYLYLNTNTGSTYSYMLIVGKVENAWGGGEQVPRFSCTYSSQVTSFPTSDYLPRSMEENNLIEITPELMEYNSKKIKRKIKYDKKYFHANSIDCCNLYFQSEHKETIWVINDMPYFIKNDANNLSHITIHSKIKQKLHIYIIDDIYDVEIVEVYAV